MQKTPLADCDRCGLKDGIFVPSEVNDKKSKVAFLAEAPGANETKDGKPFTGAAGAEINKILIELGANRKEINLLNSCGCRPTVQIGERISNRTPTFDEIRCCNKRLFNELDTLNPQVIVALGKSAYVALGGNARLNMSDIVGKSMKARNKFDVLVTYHPAAIIHKGGAKSKEGAEIRNHIKMTIEKALKYSPKPKQLSLAGM
jgi:DNA polymerase